MDCTPRRTLWRERTAQLRRWGLCLLGLWVGTAACAQDAASQPIINRYCPVLTDEKVDPAFTLSYRGRTIGFCCDRCQAKFKANPERYAANLPPEESVEEVPTTTGRTPVENADHADVVGSDESQHEHEHAHEHEDEAEREGVPRLLAWLGKFHPAAVNFPIALLIAAAAAEALLMNTRRAFFANAGRFCLWVGALGAVFAGTLGWFFGGFDVGDDSTLLAVHRWLGTTTSLWAILALVVGERAYRRADGKRRRAYRVVLFIAAGLVGVTGFLGGAMVYGIGHYAW